MSKAITENAKKRFIKDYNLPINVTKSPYFEHFVKVLDPQLHTQKLYDDFLSLIEKKYKGNDGELVQHCSILVKQLISAIEQVPKYKEFNQDKLAEYKVPEAETMKMDAIYHQGNANKTFISIDLSSANFFALKKYSKDIVLGCETYAEFIKKVYYKGFSQEPATTSTGNESRGEEDPLLTYFLRSKHVRQVIFGHLNPKKQQILQKYIVHRIAKILQEENPTVFTKDRFVSASSDEVVLSCFGLSPPEILEQVKLVQSILDRHTESLQPFKIEAFKLFFLQSPSKRNVGFVKEFLFKNGKAVPEEEQKKVGVVEFKAVPAFMYAMAVKLYFGLPIERNDKMCLFENMVFCLEEDL